MVRKFLQHVTPIVDHLVQLHQDVQETRLNHCCHLIFLECFKVFGHISPKSKSDIWRKNLYIGEIKFPKNILNPCPATNKWGRTTGHCETSTIGLPSSSYPVHIGMSRYSTLQSRLIRWRFALLWTRPSFVSRVLVLGQDRCSAIYLA